MKKIIIILLAITSYALNAQFSADADGNFNVSSLNGSLSYVYPISSVTVDGYPVNINVKYLGNLKQTAFNFYYKDDENNDGYTRLTRTQSNWAITVNGFVVQVLRDQSNFNVQTDLLLYLAARSENMNLIKKNYKKKIILIDRFIDSTIAYQHYGMGVDLKIINIINRFLLKKIRINFTFLNIVNKKNLFQRLKKRKSLNRYDQFDINFYNKVQKGFLKLAKSNKKYYKIIDSNLDIKKNEDLILNQLKKLIKWI